MSDNMYVKFVTGMYFDENIGNEDIVEVFREVLRDYVEELSVDDLVVEVQVRNEIGRFRETCPLDKRK